MKYPHALRFLASALMISSAIAAPVDTHKMGAFAWLAKHDPALRQPPQRRKGVRSAAA